MYNGPILNRYPENPGQQNGVASLQAKLLDGVTSDDVGIWIPWAPFNKGSIEVTGENISGTVGVFVSNAEDMPANGFTATVGGTAHLGDVLELVLTSDAFYADAIVATHTVTTGQTKAQAAASLCAKLVTAINNMAQDLGPDDEQQIAAGQITAEIDGSVAEQINIFYSYEAAPIGLSTAVSGSGATTTLTAGQYDSGEGFQVTDLNQTAVGHESFSLVGTWIKSTFDGTADTLTVIVQAVLP